MNLLISKYGYIKKKKKKRTYKKLGSGIGFGGKRLSGFGGFLFFILFFLYLIFIFPLGDYI